MDHPNGTKGSCDDIMDHPNGTEDSCDDVMDHPNGTEDSCDDIMYTMFKEPEKYIPKPAHRTVEYYNRVNSDKDPQQLKVNLAPKHSLWGHRFWNASKACTNYLDSNPDLYRNKCVLELGAGSSIPTIVCALNGATFALATDYPEEPLLDTIRLNMRENAPELYERGILRCAGLPWGSGIDYLRAQGLELQANSFDLVIMSDLIFNHYSAKSLLVTCKELLKLDSGTALVTFSHHVPRLAHKDLDFFSIAEKEFGFKVSKMFEETWSPMFPEDYAEELKPRSTVYFYSMSLWKE